MRGWMSEGKGGLGWSGVVVAPFSFSDMMMRPCGCVPSGVDIVRVGGVGGWRMTGEAGGDGMGEG